MADNSKQIIQILKNLAKPAAFAEIKGLLPHIAERTLTRYLANLVEQGDITASGEKRGRRYTLPRQHSTLFSAHAQSLLDYVRQPLIHRMPCSYQYDWLDSYRVGHSFYLSQEQRMQLMQAGRKASLGLPAGTYTQELFNRLLIDFSYNSSRLEGNTYSLLDTKRLLIDGVAADDKLDFETLMLLNHKEAIRLLIRGSERIEVSLEGIRSLHYLLSDGLVSSEAAGKVRQNAVRIPASTYVPIEGEERLLQQLQQIIHVASQITDPFEQSFFLLVHISYLQAF